ncbi:beta strand repeat-containing protein [Aeoliella sp. SH292]|uniref:beta strand repeat-containing protein n=1 Tax=Aeoliella sp. SH292 TaxID=3454464 RepID=UPI003F970401
MTIVWLLVAASSATAQQVHDRDTRAVEAVPQGEIVYSTDSQIVQHPADSYGPYGMDYSPSLGAHLRARYNTRSYGQVRGNLDLGTMKLFDAPNGVWFVDAQVTLNDESKIGYNAGVGYRFMTLPLFPTSPDTEKIAGISVWSDGTTTVNENFLPQIGVSLEYLGDNWDSRLNTYLPIADIEVGDFVATDNITYQGDFLVQETLAGTDEALTVTDFEVARRMGNRDLWLFGGTYGLWGETVDTAGLKLGARGYLTPDVAVQLAVNDDDEFGTNTVFSVTWFMGRTRSLSECGPALVNRMREPVIRNDYVAVKQGSTLGGETVFGDLDGDGTDEAIRVVHIDSNATAPGNGSFENPYSSIESIAGSGASPAIVLVHAESEFTGEQATLLNGQRFLGEGGGIEHSVVTSNFGTVILPETAPGALNAAVPIINGGAGENVITLASGTIEVSNFVMDGGASAIVSPTGALAIDINNMNISNTTGNAIELTAATETVNGTDRVRFQPLIEDVVFDNIGGDDINIDAASPAGPAVPVTESIVIRDVTSTNGNGVGINLSNNRSTATISNYSNDQGSGTAAILLTDNTGAINITDAEITNQTGMGVSMVGGSGTRTLNRVTITDTADAAMHVNGGSANMNFTGKITQGDLGESLFVEGGHTGTLTFREMTAGEGVIDATSGGGLVFNNADGTYTFLHEVSLVNTTQGIDVTNGSAGTLSFSNAIITDPTGTAVHFNGGSASMTFTGKITQNNASNTVLVEGGHTGTLTFNEFTTGAGVIDAFNGNGLVFSDADGAYRFNDAVVLDGSANGADTGIDMISDTDGTFEFADATITDPTGAAVYVDGGSSTFTFTGEISQNNNAAAVQVQGGHTGTMTFLSPDASTDVITATNGTGLQFNDADGDYGFVGSVVLDGSAVNADTGVDIIGGSAGDFTFGDITIVDTNGIAFNVVGGSADVDFTGNITQSNNFAAISVSGGHTGVMDFDEAVTGTGVVDASNGSGLQFDNADGTYRFNDAVTLAGGDAGVDIVGGSSGTFTFAASSEIIDPSGDAFVITNSSANVDYNGTITDSTGHAVLITNNTGGVVTFDGDVTSTGTGILVQNNTGGTFRFNGGTDLTTGTNDAVTLANNTGTIISFSDMDIETTSGSGFVATDTEGLQILGTGNTINVTAGTAGTQGALVLEDVVVTASGILIDSVSITGGSQGGIVMNNVTGGPVIIGTGNSAGDGGTITNTVGTAVSLTNVENVTIRNMEITNSGGAGIQINHTDTFGSDSTVVIDGNEITGASAQGILLEGENANDLSVTITDNVVNNTSLATVELNINGAANNADLIVTGNTLDNTSDDEALLITGNDGTIKTINLLVNENSITNDSATASAVNLESNGDSVINATFLNNTMGNSTNDAFTASTNNAGSNLRLRMEQNTATSGDGGDDYILRENAGSFRVQNLTTPNEDGDTIETANTGTFDIGPGITEFGGTVPLP